MFRKRKSLDELLEQKRQVDAELAARSGQELEALKAKLELLAEAQGVPLASLFGFAVTSEPRKRKKREARPRYVNPDNPEETWSGKGRKAAWLQEKLAAGARLEDFAAA